MREKRCFFSCMENRHFPTPKVLTGLFHLDVRVDWKQMRLLALSTLLPYFEENEIESSIHSGSGVYTMSQLRQEGWESVCVHTCYGVSTQCLTIYQNMRADTYEPENECVWLSPETLLENNSSGRLERTETLKQVIWLGINRWPGACLTKL